MGTIEPVIAVGVVGDQPGVLQFAAREADFVAAKLHVIHAVGLPIMAAGAAPGVDVGPSLEAAGQFVLDHARQSLKADLGDPEADFILSLDGPVVALERAAVSARMLVLGSDDVPWYERLFRTQVAGFLAKHVPCPVVVVPDHGWPIALEGDVVVTIDGLSSAAGPLRFAFEQASLRDGVLHVIDAVPPATMASDAADLRANMSEVLAGWRQQFPDVEVLESWAVGSPRDIAVNATHRAELVVLGRPPKNGVPFLVSRPIVMDVLRHAACPVAIVPAGY